KNHLFNSSEIKINNEDLTDYQGLTAYAARELKLPSDRSMLTLNYAALEYNFPDRISYAYFLDGWDMKWQKVAESRVANYSKIPPGKYVFKLKSTNSDGKWNDHVIELPIEILPPWYKTIWAYIAYVLLGITFWAGILYYQRERERLKYNIELSRKMAQKDKELNEKKLTFFTNISHEFCSHLTLIINPLKDVIYRSNEEIGNVPVEVEVAYHNSRRLLSLADQLLLFRKTESETGEIRVSHIDMVELTQEVFSCFLHQAKSQNVNYVFHTEEKKCLIYGDKHKLEMALFNLISNSLKFTSPQGGQVQVSLVNDQKGVIIRVEDNGSGIPKRERNTVFDLFYQYDTNKKPSTRGFGIGLYLVKKFVTLHEGKIVCTESELGGAQFEICLLKGKKHFDKDVLIHKDYGEHSVLLDELMYDEAVENAYQLPSDPVVTELMDDSKLILVIDDNAQIRKYIRKLLSDTYRIQEANSAEDGFEMIKSVEPDLIISDVVMEGMSGVDLCKKIKMSEDYGYLPVILITASSAEEIKLKGTEVGADDYITKPFDNDYLKARVRNILKRQEVIQKHLLDEVTKKHENVKLSETDKQLLDKMSELIEDHMENEDFNVRLISEKIGMSHSLLYKRVKQLTGKSINEFVRHIRLRKVASLLLTSDVQVNEAAYRAGFSDLKYFRKQFNQLYGMNPSEFQKKYKNAMMDKQYVLNESFFKKQ
ncbi:MAG: response regulator, partial [Cyclobacteriaceae bacterium]